MFYKYVCQFVQVNAMFCNYLLNHKNVNISGKFGVWQSDAVAVNFTKYVLFFPLMLKLNEIFYILLS